MISRIGKYTVEAELGRGGFGRVYRAYDPDVKRQVAIKVLIAESDPDLLRRFKVEVGTTGNLRHKNIVTLYESGEESGVPYLVMELLEGQPLETVIKGQMPLPLLDKVRIMTQVGHGLAYAHSQGVIHRDVKPGNIMLLRDGSIKIMDFGIARVANTNTMVTRAGFLMGTVPYMAPELFEPGARADEQTDVFAYGTVYYEILTGLHPFSSETDIYATIRRIQVVEPEAVSHIVPECPEALELLVHRAMGKDREIRYQSFAELVLDSEAVLRDLQNERAAELLSEVQPLIDARDLEAAETKLQQVIELDPGNREARQLRNNIRETFRRDGVQKRISTLLAESETQLRERQFAEAVQTLENALRLNKNDESVQSRLSEASARLSAYLKANKLVAEARRDQQSGRLAEALDRLKSAIALDPEHRDATTLHFRLETELDRRGRDQALRDGLDRATESLNQQRYDDALAALQYVPADSTDNDRVAELRSRIEWEKAAAEQRQRADRFNMAIGKVREKLQERDHDQAAQMLNVIASRFGTEPDASELLSQLRAQMEAQIREDEITQRVQQAQGLVDQKSFDEALDLLSEAQQSYGQESALVRLRESTERLYAAHRRSESISALLQQANALRGEGRLREALDTIADGRKRWGVDAALTSLGVEIEVEIKQQRFAGGLRDLLKRAGALNSAGKHDEAIQAIQEAAEYKDEAEVKALLTSVMTAAAAREEKRTVDSLLEAARNIEAQGSPAQALGALQDALRKYPQATELSAAADRLRARIAAEELARQRKERELATTNATAAIREALQRDEISQAAAQLAQARSQFGGESVWGVLEGEVEGRRRFLEALEAADRERQRGNFDAAEKLLARLKPAGGDAERVRAGRNAIASDRAAKRHLDEVADVRRHLEKLKGKGNQEAVLSWLGEMQRRFPEETFIEQERTLATQELARIRLLEEERRQAEVRRREEEEQRKQAERERRQKENEERQRQEREKAERERIEQARREEERKRLAVEANERQTPLPTEQAAARKPRVSKLLVAGIAAAALMAAGITFLPRMLRTTTTTTPSKTPDALVSFEIRTDPAGASVTLGNQSCVTPNCNFKLPAREYQVQARLEGYVPVDRSVTVREGERPLEFTLQPIPVEVPKPGTATGSLIIQTGVPGASVIVDKKPRGRTDSSGAFNLPLEVKGHNVSVEKTGYRAVPKDQSVKIAANASQTVRFRLEMEDATLELRGAPAGADISLNGEPLGRTNGSVFTAQVKPGDKTLQVTFGPATRNTQEKFEPGQRLALDWPSVAPPRSKPPEAKPTAEALEAKVWEGVRNSSQAADLEKFLADYPNSPHKDQAQSRLDDLVWSGTNQNDRQALQKYADRFPRGAHLRDAVNRLIELAWNATDKKDSNALRTFIDRHPSSPHNSEAQKIIDQLEKDRLAEQQRLRETRAKQEQAQQELAAQAKGIQSAIERFNAGFQNKRAREVKDIWPSVPSRYTDAMAVSGSTFVMTLRPTGEPKISGDTASILCELTQTTSARGQSISAPPKSVTVALRKMSERWIIVDPLQ
jgi:serine/threonine protein kinase